MDNNFESEFYGAQPQKPFTEKSNYSQFQQNSVPVTPQQNVMQQDFPNQPYDFVPQKPLIRQPEQHQYSQRPATQQSAPQQQVEQPYPQQEQFNPVQRTAVYQNEPQDYIGRDYSRSVYYNGYQQGSQLYPYADKDTYTQPTPAKQKGNKGLIAVIVVLSVLLVGSLCGILGYVIHTANQNDDNAQGDINVQIVPDFTMPDYVNPYDEIATEPTVGHDESDYSDKINENYKGMKLEKKPSDADKNSKYGTQYAYEKVSDSVVGILCYSDNKKSVLASQGSGIIFSKDGYVITNSHVIGDSKTAYAINVITADGKEYTAGVVGFDSRTDIAVLKMDGAKDLKPATFGDSSELRLGDDIIVVGNPGGIDFQNSMTKGIVSALDRGASQKNIVKYIQTDAAINPGNSGGPAVNMFGQIVGIACSKISGVTYEGMGFCIPSATVKTIVDSLVKNGYVEGRVKIGISGIAVSSEEAQLYSMPLGIIVSTIDPDGPCGNTDLEVEDIIVSVDGQQVTNFAEIYSILENHSDGDKVTLKYYQNKTGEYKEEEIALAADK